MSLATLVVLTIAMAIFVLAFFAFAVVSTASATVPGKNGKLLLNLSQGSTAALDDELALLNPNGIPDRIVSSQVDEVSTNTVFSPTGKEILFGGWENGLNGIWTLALRTAVADLIWAPSGSGLNETAPISYALDGKSFVLTQYQIDCNDRGCSEPYADPDNGIYRIYIRTGNTRKLDLAPEIVPTEAIFSPDGRKIAISSLGEGSSIYVANADGSSPRGIVDQTDPKDDRPFDLTPSHTLSFSPDGKRIAYARFGNISTIGIDGAGNRSLVQDGRSSGPVYSPDGTRIAYNLESTPPGYTSVRSMKVDGSSHRELTFRGGSEELLDWGRSSLFTPGRFRSRSFVQPVRVYGAGSLSVSGAKVKTLTRKTNRARTLVLQLRPNARLRRTVSNRGFSRIKIAVKFQPVGALPETRHLFVTLRRK